MVSCRSGDDIEHGPHPTNHYSCMLMAGITIVGVLISVSSLGSANTVNGSVFGSGVGSV